MKYYTLPLICIALFTNCGEKKRDANSLYYFPNDDTTYVGVKNGKGDIIIPAVHPVLNYADIADFNEGMEGGRQRPRVFYNVDTMLVPEMWYDFENPITGRTIQFAGISKDSKADIDRPRSPGGEVYNRKGEFLYYVAGYKTGGNEKGYSFVSPETFAEGYRAYVEKGKLGFVDVTGNKVTPARWDFAIPFNYGYAKVYGGGWEQIPMPGYIEYKPTTDTAYSGYINIKGEMIKTSKVARNKNDYYISNGEYLPYPFTYTPHEQKIVDSLNKIKAIRYTNLVDVVHAENNDKDISFEITVHPAAGFPYYLVQGYWEHFGQMHYTFLVHQDTGEIFYCEHKPFLEDEYIPFSQWMVDGLQKVKEEWEKTMPGVILKINMDKELAYWQGIAKERARK